MAAPSSYIMGGTPQWTDHFTGFNTPSSKGRVPGAAGSGGVTSGYPTIFPLGPGTVTTAAGVPGLNAANIAGQQAINASRIPNAAGLEGQSSDVIANLLNPPAMFADTDRQAAELGTGRGVAGSAGAFGVGLRLTDEERLRRMGLGQQFLSAAYARNPGAPLVNAADFTITPAQAASLNLQYALHNRPSVTYGGGGVGGYAGGAPGTDASLLTYPNFVGSTNFTGLGGPGPGGVTLGGYQPGDVNYGGDPVGGYGGGYGGDGYDSGSYSGGGPVAGYEFGGGGSNFATGYDYQNMGIGTGGGPGVPGAGTGTTDELLDFLAYGG